MRISELFFDLDGTLTDSSVGIVRCIQHALEAVGVEPPLPERLLKFVGPPLAPSFGELLGTPESPLVETAMAAYRSRFESTGMFENALYPGIADALDEIAARGCSMSVVTVKPRVYAEAILDHFGVRHRFADVFGPDLDAQHETKAMLIRSAIVRRGVLPGTAAMIGDRAEDVLGGRQNGLATVAVAWGYGDPVEIEAAHPDRLVRSVAELVAWVRQVTAAEERS